MDKDLFQDIHSKIKDETLDSISLKSLLSMIVSNTDTYSPTWHPLGFSHCRLWESLDTTLRIHIWPQLESNPVEQEYKIHNHIFQFKSYIITGNITNTTYTCIPNTQTPDKSTYKIHYVKYHLDKSTLEPSNIIVRCTESSRTQYKSGDYYNVTHNDYHETHADNKTLTATLVATENHKKEDPILMSDHKNDDVKQNAKTPYDKHKWKEDILSIIDIISK